MIDRMSPCEKRRELLENSETWWGQVRWKAHVRSCIACAELMRVEQEMTSLLQGLGSWEEPPGLAERVSRRVSGAASTTREGAFAPPAWSPVERSRQARSRGRKWLACFAFAAVLIACGVLIRGPLTADIAFAEMMDRLSQQASFRASGTILEGSRQGAIRYQPFEQITERDEKGVPDGNVRWNVLWRSWQSSSPLPSERRIGIEFPSNIDFPIMLFLETKRDEQGNIVESRLFPPDSIDKGSRYQFMFTGLPWMSRVAAENAIHHPAVEFEEGQEKVADKTVKAFSLSIRDTQSNQVIWKFYVSYQTRLPYRVEATYRSKTGILRQADYLVDYPSVRP
ncbi:MAG: hypothetical protein ABIN58_05240 [candidate division WOR-3 bacterium]